MTVTPSVDAVHESGHCASAALCGRKVSTVTLNPPATRFTIHDRRTTPVRSEAVDFQHALWVLRGGQMAVQCYLGLVDHVGSGGDLADLASLKAAYWSTHGAVWVRTQEQVAEVRLRAFLHDPVVKSRVMGLATALEANRWLAGAQVDTILGDLAHDFYTRRRQEREARDAARTAAREHSRYRALVWEAQQPGYYACSPFWCLEPRYLSLVTTPPPQAATTPARPQPRQPQRAKGVAVIEISGPMMKAHSWFSALLGATSTTETRLALREARLNPDISAVLLAVYSPGGEFTGSYELAAEVRATAQAKPVHAHIEDLGASAAYWAASQATRITANATAEIGSIGTVPVVRDTSVRMDRLGIKVHVLSTGQFKGAGVRGAALDNDQLAYLQERVDSLNQFFLEDVQRGRHLSAAALARVSDGRLFDAATARRVGLIDAVSDLDSVIAELTAKSAAA